VILELDCRRQVEGFLLDFWSRHRRMRKKSQLESLGRLCYRQNPGLYLELRKERPFGEGMEGGCTSTFPTVRNTSLEAWLGTHCPWHEGCDCLPADRGNQRKEVCVLQKSYTR